MVPRVHLQRFLNPHIYHEIADRKAKWPDLPVFAAESYAQCAEDLIVIALLRSLSRREGLDLAQCRYLEIGGNHPISCSATYLLNRLLGMTGVIVEANPHLIPGLQDIRDQDEVVHAAVTPEKAETTVIYLSKQDELSSLDRRFVSEWPGGGTEIVEETLVRALTINEVLETRFKDQGPLFLSIDIEGVDFEVLRSLDFARWRPAIITAEPSEHHIDGNTLAIGNLLRNSGYVIIAETDVNLIALDAARTGIDASAHTKRSNEAQLTARALALQREAEVEIARHEVECLSLENTRLEHELSAAIQELERATRSVLSYHTSTSWRVTAPLRMLARFLNLRR